MQEVMSGERSRSVLRGDSRARLKELPDESVQLCVTSPPYWGLRDYGADEQIGLEETPEFVGFEVNAEYAKIADERIGATASAVTQVGGV